MTNLMQQLLGADWEKLAPALKTHYQCGATVDAGRLDVDYPRYLQPLLSLLRLIGVLVDRRGRQLHTRVEKSSVGDRLLWRRIIHYPDGTVIRFNSYWVSAGQGQLIEFVNPLLGLQMAPCVEGGQLRYRGVRYVVKLGPLRVPIPESLLLGHTTIVETAVDETHFEMDFRITHPLLGEVFRYAGKFQAGKNE